jgi:hypothetical protein
VLLDDVADVDANPVLDALLRWQAGVALGHAELDFDCAAHGVDHATELDEDAVAGALDDAASMNRDRRVDEVAAKRAQPRKNQFLTDACEPAVADNVGGEDRREFPALRHVSTLPRRNLSSIFTTAFRID